jgi:hypothetical protein
VVHPKEFGPNNPSLHVLFYDNKNILCFFVKIHFFCYNHADCVDCFDYVVHANFVHYIVDYQIDFIMVVFHNFVDVDLELLVFSTCTMCIGTISLDGHLPFIILVGQ